MRSDTRWTLTLGHSPGYHQFTFDLFIVLYILLDLKLSVNIRCLNDMKLNELEYN